MARTHQAPLLIFRVALTLAAAAACAAFALGGGGSAADKARPHLPANPTRPGLFSPSNARTEDGRLIPAEHFFPAARCAKCHTDTHRHWAESLHRNAARAPFYKQSVNLLRDTRGTTPTQHCESCHSPVAVFSGALLAEDGGAKPLPLDDEGVTCVVCHSMTDVRLDGTGSYTIRRPALLEREDGTPVYGDVPDAAIRADVAGHRRAMMRPLLKSPKFCAACHKSTVPPELNGYKFLRGFSVYDEWQQSGASRDTVAPYYRRDHRLDCRGCHMPLVAGADDLAAVDGQVASHRWLGANTATPLYYKQTEQARLVAEFLADGVVNVDIFALENNSTGERVAPLSVGGENRVALGPGQELTVDVVIANRKAAHSFPPELRDLYEPWVEFEALDASGRTVFHSGFVRPDGKLDESAHVYKAILLDESSEVITRHEVWLAKVKAYDNSVPTGRSDLVRYRLRLPEGARGGDAGRLTLRARVNYRRFIQAYADYVSQRQGERMPNPVVRMASAEVEVGAPRAPAGATPRRPAPGVAAAAKAEARRWNDYGIGLMEQAQYGAAAAAFLSAGELSPADADPLVSAAVAEMRTERFGPEREQLAKADALLERALRLDPASDRAHFFRALLWRAQGRGREAADELEKLAAEYPRDREVARQLGQTLYALGRIPQARAAFESVLAVDPTDAGAQQFLGPIYASLGMESAAARSRALYLLWRDDPLTDVIAGRFFGLHPQWAEERGWFHTHGGDSPQRPVLAGQLTPPAR